MNLLSKNDLSTNMVEFFKNFYGNYLDASVFNSFLLTINSKFNGGSLSSKRSINAGVNWWSLLLSDSEEVYNYYFDCRANDKDLYIRSEKVLNTGGDKFFPVYGPINFEEIASTYKNEKSVSDKYLEVESGYTLESYYGENRLFILYKMGLLKKTGKQITYIIKEQSESINLDIYSYAGDEYAFLCLKDGKFIADIDTLSLDDFKENNVFIGKVVPRCFFVDKNTNLAMSTTPLCFCEAFEDYDKSKIKTFLSTLNFNDTYGEGYKLSNIRGEKDKMSNIVK